MSNEKFSAVLKENTVNCVALGWGMVTSNKETNSQSYRHSCCEHQTAVAHGVQCMSLKFGVWCPEQSANSKTTHFLFE
jgi:hypothetical protein